MATKGQSQGKGHSSEKEDQIENQINEQELEQLYAWVDTIPLSISKKSSINRDFSDGVYVAEIIRHHFPSLVDMHNYPTCNHTAKKVDNWRTLNRKVFSKMNFELEEDLMNDLASCKKGVIEKFLLMLQVKIRRAEYARERLNDKPEADQHQMSSRKGKLGAEDMKGSQFARHKQKTFRPLDPSVRGGYKQEVPKRLNPHMMESEMVSRYEVEEKEQEVHARDETIQILQAKISRLEHLLHLKDMRIEELQSRIESTRPTGFKR